MIRTAIRKRAKVYAPILATALFMAMLLVFANGRPAYSLTATVTTSEGAGGYYNLGQDVVFPVSLAFTGGEGAPQSLTLEVTGAGNAAFNPVTIPLFLGTHDLSASLPAGAILPSGTYNATSGNVGLSAIVTMTNMEFGYGKGYGGYSTSWPSGTGVPGYGYGYKGLTGGGTIDVTVTYKPPVIKYPVPASAAGPVTNPTLAFSTFTGTTTTTTSTVPNLPSMKFKNNFPPVPGSMPSAEKRGFYFDSGTSTMLVVVDGFSGQGDTIGMFGTGNFMNFKGSINPSATSISTMGGQASQIEGVAATAAYGGSVSQIAVAGGTAGTQFFGLFNASNGSLEQMGNGSSGYVDLSADFNNLDVGGVAFDAANSIAYVIGVQPDSSLGTQLTSIDLANGAKTTVEVNIGAVGVPCCHALTYLSDELALMGTAKDTYGDVTLFTFTTGGQFKSLMYPTEDTYGNPPVNEALGIGFDDQGDPTSENHLYIVRNTGDIFYGVKTGVETITTGQVSDMPIAISVDPSANEAYVVFDGNPNDGMKVLDLSAANPAATPVRTWNLSSGFVESTAFVPGTSGGPDYIWNIDSGNCSTQLLEQRSTTDGTVVNQYTMPSYISCDIGGMDVDYETGNLLIVEKYSDTVHTVSPTTGQVISTLSLWDNDMYDQFYMPMGGEAMAVETIDGDKRLLIGKQNKLYVINITTGAMLNGFNTPLMQVTGMSGGTTGTLWMADKDQKKVYKASLPGAAVDETTTAGNYGATLSVSPAPTNAATNWATTFTLDKVSSIVLTITSPENNGGVGAADINSDGKITITGTVNDQTIKTVSFGATLGVTTLVGAPLSDPTGPFNLETSAEVSAVSSSSTSAITDWETSGLWNVVTSTGAPGGNKYAGTAGFYYGSTSSWNYDTGAVTSGGADSPTFTVGAGTNLTFDTWWDTEPSFDWDQKLVQFCTSASSCTTLLQIVDMMPPPMPPNFMPSSPGTVFQPMMVGANWGEFADGRKFVFIPMGGGYGGGTSSLTSVTLPLSKTLGTGFLRFSFDSKDGFMNNFEGWYVDNIQVTGAGGAAGVGFTVDNGTWSGLFKPTEGENKITLTATHNAYDTTLGTIASSISVFMDTVDPVVSFDTVPLPIKVIDGTAVYVTGDSFLASVITGTFDELVPDMLELFTLSNASLTTLSSKNVFTDGDAKKVLSKKTFDKTTLASAAAQDAETVEVDDASGLAVGSQITIGTTDIKQTVTVTSITSNTLAIGTALLNSHDVETTVAEVNWGQDLNLGTSDTYIQLGLKLTDKGGLIATQELTLSLDTTGPSLTVGGTIYPIGASSARAEDEIIFDVTVTDALSGVENVLFVDPRSSATLASDSGINDTSIQAVGDVMASGTVILVDSGSNAEIRVITSVNASSSVPVYTLDKKLKKIHLAGSSVATGTQLLDASVLPDLVTGKYGVSGTHLAFATVPVGTPAGEFSITIAVSDTGGNTTVGAATGIITASLQALNFYVMPGGNLLGMNLQPTYASWADILSQEVATSKLKSTFVSGITLANTAISVAAVVGATEITVSSVSNLAVNDGIKVGTEARRITAIDSSSKGVTLNRALTTVHASGTVVAEYISLAALTKAVFYFTGGTASSGSWQTYTPTAAVDTLTTARQGRAYWLFLEESAFKTSTPLSGFTTGTDIPISIVIEGVLFDATAEPPSLPTTVSVVPGWNLISLIAEKNRTVEQGARGLMFPTQTFTSMAEFQKFVEFSYTNSSVNIVEGVFNPLFTGTGVSDMKVGRGFYVFMSSEDTHTP